MKKINADFSIAPDAASLFYDFLEQTNIGKSIDISHVSFSLAAYHSFSFVLSYDKAMDGYIDTCNCVKFSKKIINTDIEEA